MIFTCFIIYIYNIKYQYGSGSKATNLADYVELDKDLVIDGSDISGANRHANFYETGTDYNAKQVRELVIELMDNGDALLAGLILTNSDHIFDKKKYLYDYILNSVPNSFDNIVSISYSDFDYDEITDISNAIGTDIHKMLNNTGTNYSMTDEEIVMFKKFIQTQYDVAFTEWCDKNYPESTKIIF